MIDYVFFDKEIISNPSGIIIRPIFPRGVGAVVASPTKVMEDSLDHAPVTKNRVNSEPEIRLL